jgi:Zn-dependent protease with chaperone function
MNDSKDKFLQRMFLYNLQYLSAGALSLFGWYALVMFLVWVLRIKNFDTRASLVPFAIPLVFSLFNTITYFYSKFLAKKYGIEMFADLDQEWLREHQAFDSKAFGEIFARLIQCRKIAGPYMLAVIVPAAFINMYLATGVGVIYLIAYFFYRQTYFDTAISYKIPRAMGGGGIVVSKIIDNDFNKKLDKLNQKLEEVDKK